MKTSNNPLVERPMILHSAIMAPVPSLEVMELEKAIVNMSLLNILRVKFQMQSWPYKKKLGVWLV